MHKLTKKYQYSKECKDGKQRNYILYFLNGIQIIKQKIPFDVRWEKGFDRRTWFTDEYILNGNIHQTRTINHGCGCAPNLQKSRNVKFPISKKKLKELGVDADVKIEIYKE